MKRLSYTRLAALFLAAAMLLCSFSGALAFSESSLRELIDKSSACMLKNVPAPQVGNVGGEWAVIGLARGSGAVPDGYFQKYYEAVEACVSERGGILHDKKYTEYSRVIVALSSIGADAANVAGYNLLTPLGDFNKTVWQGLNGPIWALIALDSRDYDTPYNAEAEVHATRLMYVEEILSRQLDNGGWNLTGRGGSGSADPDITGMALQALAKYTDMPEVQLASDRAVACLSAMLDENCGYASYGTVNSESVVQVVVALCELGISLDDERFVKNGRTLADSLLSFYQPDGSFRHIAGGGSDQMASEQGLYALAAMLRAENGASSLYHMGDAPRLVSVSVSAGLVGKHKDINVMPVTKPGLTFDDIADSANKAAIEALAERGIINGMGNGSFEPDSGMTRAEFAAIITRALGLAAQNTSVFTDVSPDEWYAGYIGAANGYSIVNGVGGGLFDPEGSITRQEAAAMVARAAKLCGMDTALEGSEILNILAQFSDYIQTDGWARESVAFCYGEDIMDQSDYEIEPGRAILRCEVARMLYNMLVKAKLI